MIKSSSVDWKDEYVSDAFWFQEGPGVRQWQFTQSGIKLLNVANITTSGTIDLSRTSRYLAVDEVEKKYKHFLVDEGDLVIASSGISFDSDGLLRTRGVFVRKGDLPLCMNTSTIRFKGREGISDLRFLKFWFDSFEFRNQITKLVTGSAQQNFGPSHLQSVTIRLPPLPEQRRIAGILERADRLRRMRRYAQQMSEAFLQAVFVRMFGDPRTNPNGWSVGELQDLCTEVVDCPHATPKYAGGITAYPCVRSSDIQSGFFDWSTTLYVDESEYLKRIERTVPIANDVVYCREGARFGNAARIPNGKKVCLGQRTMLFRANAEVAVPEFIWGFLESKSTYRQAVSWAGGSASPHVNVQDIRAFRTIIPPPALQQQFARIVQRFERLRGQQREAERQAEQLFQALLQRAFGGGL